MSRGRQGVSQMLKFVYCNDLQTSLRDCQGFGRHIARNEKFGMSVAGIDRAKNEFEPLRREIITDLFLNFPHNTVEKALIAFASTPKKTDLSWISNVRNVVAQLEKKAAIRVEEYCLGASSQFQRSNAR